jgi:Ca2+-binding RTX toxin-like protein
VLTGDGGANVIHGGDGDDEIHGGGGTNTLEGDGGNDTLFAEGVNEGFSGGAGNDTVDYSLAISGLARTGLVIDLRFPSNNTGAAANDLYDTIENLTGTNKSDDLRGDDNANTIKGLSGNDILQGRGGLDTLTGGLGEDTYHLDDVTGSVFMLTPAFDSVVENPNEGTDTVLVSPLGRFSPTLGQTFYSYTLPANVETGATSTSAATTTST